MNKQAYNQLDMFLLLKTFFQDNTSQYLGHSALIQSVSVLNQAITDIFELSGKTLSRRAYSTESKADRKKELIDMVIHYYIHLQPWFYNTPDPSAPMETRTTPAAIKYANDAKLLLIALKMRDYVQTNLAALAGYGFNAPLQTQLQQAITAFEAISDMPFRERDNRKQDLKALAAVVDKARNLVRKDITIYMGIYYSSAPTFYALFKQASKLGQPGTRTMALRVKVQTVEGKPIMGCTISVQSIKPNHKPKEAITKRSGMVQFQNLPNGLCTITASLADGQTLQQEAEIKSSERADVVITVPQ